MNSIETEEDGLKYLKEMKPKLSSKKCHNCNSINVMIDTNMGNMICTDCGTELIDAIILLSEDYCSNDNENNYCRTSENLKGIGVKVQATKVKGGNPRFAHMHKWTNNSNNYKNATYNKKCNEMNSMIDKEKLGIKKKITDHAQELYKIYKEKTSNTKRAEGEKGILAGCLYWSCIKDGFSITNEKLAKIYDIDMEFLNRGISIIYETIKIHAYSVNTYMFEIKTVEDYIRKYCSSFKLEDKYTDMCVKMGKFIDENIDSFSNTPATLACAVIYHINLKEGIFKLSEIKKLINDNCQAKATTAMNCEKNVIAKNIELFDI